MAELGLPGCLTPDKFLSRASEHILRPALQDALGLATATSIATDPLADKPDAPQTMQPPAEVADLQHQVDGLKLQLTEITVLLTKIITSKTDDVDDAPAPVTDPAPTRSAPTRSAPTRSAPLAQDRSDLINTSTT